MPFSPLLKTRNYEAEGFERRRGRRAGSGARRPLAGRVDFPALVLLNQSQWAISGDLLEDLRQFFRVLIAGFTPGNVEM